MISWPPPDAELVAMAAQSSYVELARIFQRSRYTVEWQVRIARIRLITPQRKPEDRRIRRCLYCGKPHDSSGPGDRYHKDCRSQVTALDAGRYES